MDDLDREIAVAAREARQRVWRGRMATLLSTLVFLIVAGGGAIALFALIPGETLMRGKLIVPMLTGLVSAGFVRKRLSPSG